MSEMPNIVNEFNKLIMWMPDFMQSFMKMGFLFFCATAMITIVSKFVRFVRRKS